TDPRGPGRVPLSRQPADPDGGLLRARRLPPRPKRPRPHRERLSHDTGADPGARLSRRRPYPELAVAKHKPRAVSPRLASKADRLTPVLAADPNTSIRGESPPQEAPTTPTVKADSQTVPRPGVRGGSAPYSSPRRTAHRAGQRPGRRREAKRAGTNPPHGPPRPPVTVSATKTPICDTGFFEHETRRKRVIPTRPVRLARERPPSPGAAPQQAPDIRQQPSNQPTATAALAGRAHKPEDYMPGPVSTLAAAIVAEGVPKISPNSTGLPGVSTLINMVGGLMTIGFVICVAGVIGGGITSAVCAATNNPYGALAGKRAVAVSLLGALLTSAAWFLVNFFVEAGSNLR